MKEEGLQLRAKTCGHFRRKTGSCSCGYTNIKVGKGVVGLRLGESDYELQLTPENTRRLARKLMGSADKAENLPEGIVE